MVQLLPFPRTDGQLLEKVQAFVYFKEIVHQHRSWLSSSTIQQAYTSNTPLSAPPPPKKLTASATSCPILSSMLATWAAWASLNPTVLTHPSPSNLVTAPSALLLLNFRRLSPLQPSAQFSWTPLGLLCSISWNFCNLCHPPNCHPPLPLLIQTPALLKKPMRVPSQYSRHPQGFCNRWWPIVPRFDRPICPHCTHLHH